MGGMLFIFRFKVSSFNEAHPLDKPAGAIGERVGFGEGLPKCRAVIGIDGVGEFVGDNVIDDPGRPFLDLIADADVAFSGAAYRAAPKPAVHIPDPSDGFPFDLAVEIFAVDFLSALVQVCMSAAGIALLLLSQLSGNVFQYVREEAFRQPVRDAEQNRAVFASYPTGGFLETFIPPNDDVNKAAFWGLNGMMVFCHVNDQGLL